MAITITANDATGDGSGIDFAAYLDAFDATYAPVGFGHFSTSSTDFSGNQYASTEQANLIPNATKQSVIFESGGGGKSIDYTFANHTVGGDLDAISFGYGTSYDSATDSFPLMQLDLRISGLGFVDQFGSGNIVSALITDAMAGTTATLRNLLAANAINFIGSTGADVFTGFSYNDTIFGGGGSDTLDGAGGDDILDGGTGADEMRGGAGNDTFIVDNAGDKVIEASGAGTDTVESSVAYTLSANVENLTLTGTANINANGNVLVNILTGNSGNNTLDGKAGADTMRGGQGNDIYVVDNAGDKVIEASGAGTDTVRSAVSHTLSANVENLTLTGTANINANGNALVNILTGNAGNNTLDGKAGADTMRGGKGNDVYVVDNAGDKVIEASGAGTDTVRSAVSHTLSANVENLTLTGAANINANGNVLVNILTGNSGNNTLDGKAGADTMRGGKGNDVYVVDNAGDKVIEASGAGTDAVRSAVSHTLSANVENLTLTGAANINANGNVLVNILTGNAGNNTLDGKAGADTMRGGKGNDVYVVDNAGDKVIEASGAGTDTVRSAVSHTLSANVENLTLTGTANIDASGNLLANTIIGNGRNNIIDGNRGNDILTGGAGKDVFVFSSALNGTTNVDTITDFSVPDDTIRLAQGIFSTLAPGTLTSDAFHIGGAAADALDRIIYDNTTGALLYDADGTGAGAAVKFATLSAGLALTHNDFDIV